MELTRLALLCLAALATAQDPQNTSPARPGPPGTKYVCRQIDGCDADIAMLVDKSGSITAPEDGGAPENWRILKDFIYAVMRQTNFGGTDAGAKFSVLFFANNANLKVKFNECNDIDCARQIIETVNGPGGRTNTNAAFQTAIREIYTTANGDRPNEPDIIILITDGKPNPYNAAELAATIRQVRDRNIRVIGVGIGNGVDHDIMRSLVSPPDSENYFQIKDFASIVAELEEILQRACTVCEYVPCFTDWSEWSACSTTCEQGVQTRNRGPRDAGDVCEGPTSETRTCTGPRCECYGPWSEWSVCDVTCGEGMETRNRSPLGERRCETPSSETRACSREACPCYGPWGQWSSCDVTCGNGIERRNRSPLGERRCEDPAEETRQCSLNLCPCYGPWSAWSACSVTCGGGVETRNRDKLVERRCEGSTSQSRSCAPEKCGCDPETIDFYGAAIKVEPYEKFIHEWLTGTWYASRWYLPQKNNITDEIYDEVTYSYKKPGNPKVIVDEVFSREKTSQCCNDVEIGELHMRSTGVYDWVVDGKTEIHIIYPYASDVFLLEIYCIGPNEAGDRCDDYGAMMWSRCPKPRSQDIAKALTILKKICYPHMNRFLCSKHEKDCTKMNYHENDMKEKDCGCDKKMYDDDHYHHYDDHYHYNDHHDMHHDRMNRRRYDDRMYRDDHMHRDNMRRDDDMQRAPAY